MVSTLQLDTAKGTCLIRSSVCPRATGLSEAGERQQQLLSPAVRGGYSNVPSKSTCVGVPRSSSARTNSNATATKSARKLAAQAIATELKSTLRLTCLQNPYFCASRRCQHHGSRRVWRSPCKSKVGCVCDLEGANSGGAHTHGHSQDKVCRKLQHVAMHLKS